MHVPSDLIAAYEPGQMGSLVGDKSTSVVFDNSKIKRFVPDFVCTVSWMQGVRRTVDWFMANKKRRAIDQAANAKWDEILRGYARAQPGAQ